MLDVLGALAWYIAGGANRPRAGDVAVRARRRYRLEQGPERASGVPVRQGWEKAAADRKDDTSERTKISQDRLVGLARLVRKSKNGAREKQGPAPGYTRCR